MPRELLLPAALIALTVAAYVLARGLYLRYQHPLVQPVFLGAAVVAGTLSATELTFDEYRPAKDLMTWLLGPVTVALAVPVYKQRARLRHVAFPLAWSVAAGTMATIAAVLGLAALARLDEPLLGALAIKSVTAPIAIELAKLQGGDASLTAALVIATGTLGAMLGPAILTRCRVTDPVARGFALGTASHGQGTAAALLEGESAGAMASLAMVGAALFTAGIAPVYIPFLMRLLMP